jgi:heparan-alpha-glucosaminide N-acetyltransferase
MTVAAPLKSPSISPAARSAELSPSLPPASRLLSLDAYRGFVMLLMASDGLNIARYVRDTHAGGLWPAIAWHTDHVQWRGCALWDLIQPSFTFIVGVALPFSLAKRRSQGQTFPRLFVHAFVRSLVLIALGIFLRSIGRPQTNFTFEDTLTQIGLGYTFVFLIAWTRPRWQAAFAALILFAYWLAFALHPLPAADYNYQAIGQDAAWRASHGLRGFAAHWDKNTNLAAAFDTWFLNKLPRSRPFTVNGGGYLTLSFIPTLATMILGLLAGNVMRCAAKPPARKVLILLIAGILGLLIGTFLDLTGICPVVKRIWTPSWVLFSGGWCCLLLAAFYTLIDWNRWHAWAFPLVVVGMNSIAMYCMADAGLRSFIRDSFHTHLGREFFINTFGHFAPVAEMSAVLFILWLICFWMYRRKIFLRI